jgi:hypothetical protein
MSGDMFAYGRSASVVGRKGLQVVLIANLFASVDVDSRRALLLHARTRGQLQTTRDSYCLVAGFKT